MLINGYALDYLYEKILDERPSGTPYDDPSDERWRLEFGLCDEEEKRMLESKFYGGGK